MIWKFVISDWQELLSLISKSKQGLWLIMLLPDGTEPLNCCYLIKNMVHQVVFSQIKCGEMFGLVDIWSVGCLFAELLRRKPFLPGSDSKLLWKKLGWVLMFCLLNSQKPNRNYSGSDWNSKWWGNRQHSKRKKQEIGQVHAEKKRKIPGKHLSKSFT